MSKRQSDLFDQIVSFSALRRAAKAAIRGKRRNPGPAAFTAGLESELLHLVDDLKSQRYRPGKYVEIEIFDPKHRIVSAAPFRDRVVHHALMTVVAPLFERGFIHHSYANRKGKGTHRAIKTYERYRNRHDFVLRADIYRYFPAIDHALLKKDLRRRVACPRTLDLLDLIIDGSNKQEPVHDYYPGDDLFAPYQRRRGLPIGNLTSQWFANIYLDPLDHFCTERLQAPYLRYVDDFALFAHDKRKLIDWREQIDRFLARRRLRLHPRKTFIQSTSEPSTFLGFELLASGRRRLPEESVDRARRQLRSIKDQLKAGTLTPEKARERVQAIRAHAEFAHTRKLMTALLRDLPADVKGRPIRKRRKKKRKPDKKITGG